jgi:A/G-specific adenine glycosylase
MDGEADYKRFRRLLLAWFRAHARDLPWRRTRDPYAIWISEIMLQQTRVAAVIDYYLRFMERYPTVAALAAASEDEVLAYWSGLGYYRRARMLHRAARHVVAELGGNMPQSSSDLRALPGIGEYTCAAIASIAHNQPIACVDGNVERVLTRVFARHISPGDARLSTQLRQDAARLVDPKYPGDFNQAMMELGATICLPRDPACLICPVRELCLTRGEHPATPSKKMRTRQVSYAFVQRYSRRRQREVLLEQRPAASSLMPGMWDLPPAAPERESRLLLELRHSITVTNYQVSVYGYAAQEQEDLPAAEGTRRWIRASELIEIPLTGLARKVLKRLDVIPNGNTNAPLPCAGARSAASTGATHPQ